MVLLELQTESALILTACIWIVAILLGWLADSALQDAGFGLLGNLVFCMSGAFGGLFLLDYALAYQYLPYYVSDVTAWVFAGFLGAAAMMVAATLTKVLVFKL